MAQALGHIAQVVGPVVDVHFDISAHNAETELPRINDALEVTRPDGRALVLEVQQHIGEDT
ncbi:MAG: F0F1 ATP synthase subunit beta, partial [Bacteroidales bacterium]|nr:F0F1 ATP synthase subunit beta [Bacteroidales bacterium]